MFTRISVTLAVVLFSVQAGAAEFTLRFAHSDPGMSDNPHHIMVLEARRLIEERTNQRIRVAIFSSQQLGNDTETVQQIQGNILEAALVYPQSMVTFVPEIQVLEIPYLFGASDQDPDHVLERVLSSPLLTRLGRALQGKFNNVRLVSAYGNQWRDFATSFPLRSIEDMRGRAIRTIPSPIQQAFIANLGGNPTIVNSSEVFTALNTGLINGTDYGVMHLYSIRIVDYIKHVFADHHVPIVCYIVANRRWLESLPEELRSIVHRSFEDAARFGTRNAVERARFCAAQFTEKHGGSIYHPDEADLRAFRQAAGPIRQMYMNKYGRAWLDLTESAIAAAVRELKSAPPP
jgi:TRAP-type C4-dicarboxylate transport system substrate-binding protein